MTRDGVCYRLPSAEHRINEIGSGLWRTPTAIANQLAPSMIKHPSCRAWWPTPDSTHRGPAKKWAGKRPSGAKEFLTLQTAVKLWPTPRASANENRQTKPSPSQLAGKHGRNLASEVHLWPTPAARDYRDSHADQSETFENRKNHSRGVNLVEELQRRNSGIGGALNPNWVEWLMGWPLSWTSLEPLGSDEIISWETEPDVPRTAVEVKNRVNRLKALGNGQVSICAATAWQLLA